jgi:hypothetical protein
MDMTVQGRVKRAHHQLPMFIELIMAKLLACVAIPRKRISQLPMRPNCATRVYRPQDRRNAAEKDTACSIHGLPY